LYPHGVSKSLSGKTSGQRITATSAAQVEHAIIIDFGSLAMRTGITGFGGYVTVQGTNHLMILTNTHFEGGTSLFDWIGY
jgi:Flp pilus assembly pilin Flp